MKQEQLQSCENAAVEHQMFDRDVDQCKEWQTSVGNQLDEEGEGVVTKQQVQGQLNNIKASLFRGIGYIWDRDSMTQRGSTDS